MGYLKTGRQVFFFYRKSMVLRCDFDLTGLAIEDRLVGPAMTKFEFVRATTEGLTQELVT